MVLEATMIVLDTSEYMRNGDYFPTRLSAEHEAAVAVFSTKTRQNPENTAGLMTLSGDVKVTFVSDQGRFRVGLREAETDGAKPRFAAAIQVAQLALRHRQNRNQRQRIVVFVGSPIEDSERDLAKLAARMKKNNIAIDIVAFGQEGDNSTKLAEFVNAVNSGDNSHFLDAPPGVDELVDQVRRSPVLSEGSGNAQSELMGNDMDLEDDPELAMALRMSLEEERQRQERQTQE